MAGTVVVRQARPEDGAALEAVIEQINNETEFLGVPGEGHPWQGRFAQELARLSEDGSGAMFVAVDRDAIVGYLSAFAGWYARNRGSIFIAVVGLREAYRGRGLGTRLFAAVEEWARSRGAWRLDLRVSSLNERGQALYRKRGFAIEGRIRQGVLRHGTWTDDFWMGKLLDPGLPPASVPTAVTCRGFGGQTIDPLVLREMCAGDGAAFRDWDRRMAAAMPWALKHPYEVPGADAIERDIADPDADPHCWVVAVRPNVQATEAIVGMASASIEQRFRMRYDAFVNVAVLPEWTGRGVGRRLHRRVEDWARGLGARRLTALVQAPNLGGRGFAAALGYDEEVVMRGYARIDGALVDRLRLGKLLAG